MTDKKKNIVLIVSHIKETYEQILNLLGEVDFEYVFADSINKALNSITYKLPSIIISEEKINSENGFTFLKKIRKNLKTKLIPFIFLAEKESNEKKIEAIKIGADAFLQKPLNKEELYAYVISKISHFNEFYLLSITDELTRLFNRREVLKKFINEITENPKNTISIAIIDLDFFKQVNDIYGHQMGDEVLKSFAKILKNHISTTFFPTRFGGEEFVILFPSLKAKEAKIIIDTIREEFSSREFIIPQKKSFYVSYSAGLSEYPLDGQTLSVLLSRADQALYTAKKDGRGRSYIFTPAMARNDRFWEYMKKTKGLFISHNNDSITKLPYLPTLLEEISNWKFEINCIGIIIIKLDTIFDFQSYYGYKNYDFLIENIKIIIEKACLKNYASDFKICLSDFYSNEFTILFPIIVNFNLNKKKFINLTNLIINDIKNSFVYYPIDLSTKTSLLFFNKHNPKKIIRDINNIRKKIKTEKTKKNIFLKLSNNLKKDLNILKIFDIKYIYDIEKEKKLFIYPIIKNYSFIKNDIFINENLKKIKDIEIFFSVLKNKFEKTNLPLLIPLIQDINLKSYFNIVKKVFKNNEVYVTINEFYRTKTDILNFNKIIYSLPRNIKIALDNCFIGPDVLNFISLTDFSLILISEHVTRNIHFFKDKIKIVNGFKIFLDQMNIKTCVKNIVKEEELQLIQDLKIKYAFGPILNSRKIL